MPNSLKAPCCRGVKELRSAADLAAIIHVAQNDAKCKWFLLDCNKNIPRAILALKVYVELVI